jgi:hypothetical protein
MLPILPQKPELPMEGMLLIYMSPIKHFPILSPSSLGQGISVPHMVQVTENYNTRSTQRDIRGSYLLEIFAGKGAQACNCVCAGDSQVSCLHPHLLQHDFDLEIYPANTIS